MSNWEDYSRLYDENDITPNTIVIELTSSGMACAPVAFSFWFLVNDIEALPGFHEALAEVIASEDEDEGTSQEEVTKVMPITDFLADERNQADLLIDYNSMAENPLPAGYKFKLPGDEALIADAISAHNQNQF